MADSFGFCGARPSAVNDELALRSSIGLFLFVPLGVNEQLIDASGFRLLKHEDSQRKCCPGFGTLA